MHCLARIWVYELSHSSQEDGCNSLIEGFLFSSLVTGPKKMWVYKLSHSKQRGGLLTWFDFQKRCLFTSCINLISVSIRLPLCTLFIDHMCWHYLKTRYKICILGYLKIKLKDERKLSSLHVSVHDRKSVAITWFVSSIAIIWFRPMSNMCFTRGAILRN